MDMMPQTSILLWILASATMISAANNLRNETDRLALIEFKNHILDDPQGVLNSWNDSIHHCKWQGITCNARHQRVMAITLRGKSLFGSISPHIGNLSFLQFIELGENRFYDEIPQELGHLFRLRTLNLTENQLSGEIPVNLSQCLELKLLNLNINKLEGKIPVEMSNLKNLAQLYLSRNNLSGGIPPSFGNLSSLDAISLAYNELEGTLPVEIGSLTKLTFLNVGINKLSGRIPSSVYNISSITTLGVNTNFFYGKIPTNLGLMLPNLESCHMSGNQFSGNVPVSLVNASKLEVIDFSRNNLQGQVPNDLGNLPNLQWLNLGYNRLGSNSTGDLSFISALTNCSSLQTIGLSSNKFGGELPNQVVNLSFQLTQLAIGSNGIFGKIPLGLGSFINLYVIGFELNYFSGIIPSDFGKLQKLQGLYLAGNRLYGEIPSSFCNITSLTWLDLGDNRFEGKIPSCLGEFQQLTKLFVWGNNFSGILSPQIFASYFSPTDIILSYNSLTGPLPLEIGKLTDINIFSAAYNKFSGEIPSTFGDCKSLEHLELQGNFFNGKIPLKLASLRSIQYLDLSLNNLTGNVPWELQNISSLKYLNLSFNDLEGEIPINGVFGNSSQIILDGNVKLCGGIPELNLPSCPFPGNKKGKSLIVILLSTLLPMILIFITLTYFYLSYQKRHKRNVSFEDPFRVNKILRISYRDLHLATMGFSPENLIGSGSFGTVYKGKLDGHGGKLVAIKVLDLKNTGASKSFMAECRALRKIRHRNLVSILTYVSSVDFRNQEFKALVYEFMENGSLDMWLHSVTDRKLNFYAKLKIAIDVASALDYLHNNYDEEVIVHCDLKPSNILLDSEFTAHVGDFGLARLLPKHARNSLEQGTSSTIAIKGTIGYAAPEYGMGGDPSTHGDVYSYGILLLEMFTGKRPTDDAFVNGLDLHNYVKMNLPRKVLSIIDSSLAPGEQNEDCVTIEREEIIETFGGNENFENWVISMLMVGLKCSATSPKDRMNMNDVIRELHQINDSIFGDQ